MGKTNLYRSVRRWLLLLLLLPVSICAKEVSQAMLYIEKTDGSVVKIPIVAGYPILRHSLSYDNDVIVPYLDITYKEGSERNMYILQSEIKRLYTGFEASGVEVMQMDEGVQPEQVYTLGGRYIGTGSQVLQGQPKGVYVVKKGNKYVKIVRP